MVDLADSGVSLAESLLPDDGSGLWSLGALVGMDPQKCQLGPRSLAGRLS